jgi:ribosomal protein S18 acetylase RimI-like enzyme
LKKDILDLLEKEEIKLISILEFEDLEVFESSIDEYTEFLIEDALILENKNISKTHLLVNKEKTRIFGYMTLLAGSIKLSIEERDKHGEIPYESVPCLKIGKLAVDKKLRIQYNGIGTLLIELALALGIEIGKMGIGCRFLIVDADIENNDSVIEFYKKCGFKFNEKYKKKKKQRTISMRKDIYG